MAVNSNSKGSVPNTPAKQSYWYKQVNCPDYPGLIAEVQNRGDPFKGEYSVNIFFKCETNTEAISRWTSVFYHYYHTEAEAFDAVDEHFRNPAWFILKHG